MRMKDADDILEKLGRMIGYCETNKMEKELTVLFQVGDAIMDCPTIDADDCKNLMYVMCAGQDKNFVIAMEQVIDDTPTINMDYMAKINLWLIQRYRDDLFKEFGVHPNDISAVMKMFDKIYEEQCKEMPLPWYQYGLGLKETET